MRIAFLRPHPKRKQQPSQPEVHSPSHQCEEAVFLPSSSFSEVSSRPHWASKLFTPYSPRVSHSCPRHSSRVAPIVRPFDRPKVPAQHPVPASRQEKQLSPLRSTKVLAIRSFVDEQIIRTSKTRRTKLGNSAQRRTLAREPNYRSVSPTFQPSAALP